MKKTIIALLSAFSIFFTMNCYGGFVVTRKIYNWNGGLGNKWVRSIAMWVMIIIPVYPVASLLDFIVLNTLEFWTGSNPLAMQEGQSETQIVQRDDKKFEITATKNQFAIREINKKGELGQPVLLVYEPDASAWFMKAKGKSIKISESNGDSIEQVKLFHPDGRVVNVKL